MRKYGSSDGRIVTDSQGEPMPIRRTASQPLDDYDVLEIEREDGPAVQDPEE
jgi:hypothetical protein